MRCLCGGCVYRLLLARQPRLSAEQLDKEGTTARVDAASEAIGH